MDSIEQHRRKIAASGIIDPDCLPQSYWTRYAEKRAAEKELARATAACADRVAKAGDCPGCRLVTDPATAIAIAAAPSTELPTKETTSEPATPAAATPVPATPAPATRRGDPLTYGFGDPL